jgi:hypothetical protein
MTTLQAVPHVSAIILAGAILLKAVDWLEQIVALPPSSMPNPCRKWSDRNAPIGPLPRSDGSMECPQNLRSTSAPRKLYEIWGWVAADLKKKSRMRRVW